MENKPKKSAKRSYPIRVPHQLPAKRPRERYIDRQKRYRIEDPDEKLARVLRHIPIPKFDVAEYSQPVPLKEQAQKKLKTIWEMRHAAKENVLNSTAFDLYKQQFKLGVYAAAVLGSFTLSIVHLDIANRASIQTSLDSKISETFKVGLPPNSLNGEKISYDRHVLFSLHPKPTTARLYVKPYSDGSAEITATSYREGLACFAHFPTVLEMKLQQHEEAKAKAEEESKRPKTFREQIWYNLTHPFN